MSSIDAMIEAKSAALDALLAKADALLDKLSVAADQVPPLTTKADAALDTINQRATDLAATVAAFNTLIAHTQAAVDNFKVKVF